MKKIILFLFLVLLFTGISEAKQNPKNNSSPENYIPERNLTHLNIEIDLPEVPILLYPLNAATCISVRPVFNWNDAYGATSYRIQVSTTPDFTVNALDVSGISQSQYMPAAGILTYYTLYYWRVNASNSSGTSGWSNTLNFVTAPATPPAPILTYPQNGVTNLPLSFTFNWYMAHGATSYRLQVSQSASFTNTVVDAIVDSNQFYLWPGVLNYLTAYYWRLSATNCGGTSSWSAVWAFVTGGPTAVKLYGGESPSDYKLYDNFPNPFNPSTKIRFDLPKTSAVKLTIYEITGKEIEILTNQILGAGRYETEWNAGKYSSGMYFYKLETDKFTDVKKLVLIK